ncbi:MAG: hypothetical protein OEQ49_12435 [Myxococcales bacterium]|nr:hypothetical protein [Myxococcales bacterium]
MADPIGNKGIMIDQVAAIPPTHAIIPNPTLIQIHGAAAAWDPSPLRIR